MTSGLRLILISNLVTILVTAVAVLLALHVNPSLMGDNMDDHHLYDDNSRILQQQNEGDCCDCDTGEFIPPPPIGGVCFSSKTMVELESGESVAMNQLRLGDRVLVSPETRKYEPIYSFGHFTTQTNHVVEFLQITTNASGDKSAATPLEMTPNHLLFVQKYDGTTIQNVVIPASSLQVGDKVLYHAKGKQEDDDDDVVVTVTSIQRKKRTDGIFAPFTPSGTIVTNGIQSSCFATIQDSEMITLGSAIELPINYHDLGRIFESPHRLYCQMMIGGCTTETYNDEGMSAWVERPMHALEWMLQQDNMLLSGILFGLAFVVLIVWNMVEYLILNWMFVVTFVIVVSAMSKHLAIRRRRTVGGDDPNNDNNHKSTIVVECYY